jgi:predicted phage tail protein
MAEAEFILTGSDVKPRLFRVVSNKEVEKNVFEIVALEHDETKYARVEFGVNLTPRKTSILDTSELPAPTNLKISEVLYRSNNQVRSKVSLSWEPGKKVQTINGVTTTRTTVA